MSPRSALSRSRCGWTRVVFPAKVRCCDAVSDRELTARNRSDSIDAKFELCCSTPIARAAMPSIPFVMTGACLLLPCPAMFMPSLTHCAVLKNRTANAIRLVRADRRYRLRALLFPDCLSALACRTEAKAGRFSAPVGTTLKLSVLLLDEGGCCLPRSSLSSLCKLQRRAS